VIVFVAALATAQQAQAACPYPGPPMEAYGPPAGRCVTSAEWFAEYEAARAAERAAEAAAKAQHEAQQAAAEVAQKPAVNGGTPPTVNVSTNHHWLAFQFPHIASETCSSYAGGPISVEITDTHTYTVILSSQCGGSWSPGHLEEEWTVATTLDEGGNGPRATFKPGYVSNGTSHLSYKVGWNGRMLSAGYFTVKTTVTEGEEVFQGTDAFVNYCIDQNQEVHSSEGRLYCTRPGYTSYNVQLSSAPPLVSVPTLTASAARKYTAVALERELGRIRSLHTKCLRASHIRYSCAVRFQARGASWRGTTGIFYSGSGKNTQWNYTFNLRGYPKGCRRNSCSRALVVR
jgi:hypothetical protein